MMIGPGRDAGRPRRRRRSCKLDVRDVDEWVGNSSSPYGQDFCPRKGRIPGVEVAGVVSADEADAAGSDVQVAATRSWPNAIPSASTAKTPVYLFCFKGARASNTLVALKEAGIEDVRLYFGSFNEWSRDPALADRERSAMGARRPHAAVPSGRVAMRRSSATRSTRRPACAGLRLRAGGCAVDLAQASSPPPCSAPPFPNPAQRRACCRRSAAARCLAALAEVFPLGAATALAEEGSGKIEKPDLKIGFIPITCASPIIMAQPLGFYSQARTERRCGQDRRLGDRARQGDEPRIRREPHALADADRDLARRRFRPARTGSCRRSRTSTARRSCSPPSTRTAATRRPGKACGSARRSTTRCTTTCCGIISPKPASTRTPTSRCA